jgi:hypothetical protein
MFIPAYWVFPLDELGAAATTAALLVAAAAALEDVLVAGALAAGVEVRAIVTMVVLGAAAPAPAPGTH